MDKNFYCRIFQNFLNLVINKKFILKNKIQLISIFYLNKLYL